MEALVGRHADARLVAVGGLVEMDDGEAVVRQIVMCQSQGQMANVGIGALGQRLPDTLNHLPIVFFCHQHVEARVQKQFSLHYCVVQCLGELQGFIVLLLCGVDVAQRGGSATAVAQGVHQQGVVAQAAKQLGGIGVKGKGFVEQLVFPIGETEVVLDKAFQALHLGLRRVASVDGEQGLAQALCGGLRLLVGDVLAPLLKASLSRSEIVGLVMAGREDCQRQKHADDYGFWFHRFTNFSVVSPTLIKYIPAGKMVMSICWVSAEMLPVSKVCPIRLVMR